MTQVLAVALGGALGALARYGVGLFVGERFPTRFPLATLIVNVVGSFVIGFFLTLASERVQISPFWRLAVAVGFVGAFTTFSTFEFETFKLVEAGDAFIGLLNVIVSVTLGFLALWAGIVAARQVPVTSVAALVPAAFATRRVRVEPSEPPETVASDGVE